MTEQDMKLAEAGKYLNKAEGFGEYSLNDDRIRIGRQRLIMLMKEFAIDYHQAKMEKVTDEDIERQVKQINRREALCTVDYYSTGFIEGAKAMRDGLIKHKEE
jgi:hypothetical protein